MIRRKVLTPVIGHNGNSHSAVTYTAVLDGCPTSNLSEWHMQFNIPDLQSFSQHAKNAVNTGVITAGRLTKC